MHQISTFLQVALTRYSVWLHTIMDLVPVTVEVARQHQTENTVATVIFDIALAAVRGQPLLALTITSLLEVGVLVVFTR